MVYNLNMLSGFSELRSSSTPSSRHLWCLAHKSDMKAHLAIGATCAATAFFFLTPTAWLLLIPAVVLSMIYVFPMLNSTRLREVGLWKIFFIATVWALVTVLLPAATVPNAQYSVHLASMTAERWLFIFALAIPFDIRDIHNDRAKGIRTLPSQLGVQKAIRLAIVALVVFLGVAMFRLYIHHMYASITAYFTVGIMAMLLVSQSNSSRSDLYCTLYVDGMMFMLSALVFVFSYPF